MDTTGLADDSNRGQPVAWASSPGPARLSGNFSSGNTTSYIQSVATTWGISLTSDNLTLTRNSTNTACAPTGGTPNVSEVTITYTFQTWRCRVC